MSLYLKTLAQTTYFWSELEKNKKPYPKWDCLSGTNGHNVFCCMLLGLLVGKSQHPEVQKIDFAGWFYLRMPSWVPVLFLVQVSFHLFLPFTQIKAKNAIRKIAELPTEQDLLWLCGTVVTLKDYLKGKYFLAVQDTLLSYWNGNHYLYSQPVASSVAVIEKGRGEFY